MRPTIVTAFGICSLLLLHETECFVTSGSVCVLRDTSRIQKIVGPNSRKSVGLKMSEEKPVKQVASALGGILGNLKSGKGLFGTEATTSFSKVVLTTVEQQITEVGQEMRSADSAQSLKKSDNAVTAKVAPVSKPQYTADERWDVSLVSAGRESIEITVRPTQPAKLLIKAWAKENGVNPEEWDLVVPAGVSWTAGIVDPEGPIGESGILPAATVRLVKREY